jgi:hypothetical protein
MYRGSRYAVNTVHELELAADGVVIKYFIERRSQY